jgi:hypothetical protein
MRWDMAKVIVERPRSGGLWVRSDSSWNGDEDSAPMQSNSPGRKSRPKSLSERLGPLVRYLHRQVGRPWDKVYSEIRRCISDRSTVQSHLLDHLFQFVELHVDWVDGKPCYRAQPSMGRWAGLHQGRVPVVSWSGWAKFYVCPQTGLLCRAPAYRKPRAEPQRIAIEDDRQWIRRDGAWHECRLADLPDSPKAGCETVVRNHSPFSPSSFPQRSRKTWTRFDVFLRCNIHSPMDELCRETYGCRKYCIACRRLRRTELRRRGLQ